MRTIKFRVWDKDENKMFSLGDTISDEKVAYYLGGNDLEPQYNSIVLMQFTGLLDKHEKEIYESDIVTLKYQGDSGKTAMVVEWDNENFGWYFVRGKNPKYSLAISSLKE